MNNFQICEYSNQINILNNFLYYNCLQNYLIMLGFMLNLFIFNFGNKSNTKIIYLKKDKNDIDYSESSDEEYDSSDEDDTLNLDITSSDEDISDEDICDNDNISNDDSENDNDSENGEKINEHMLNILEIAKNIYYNDLYKNEDKNNVDELESKDEEECKEKEDSKDNEEVEKSTDEKSEDDNRSYTLIDNLLGK